MSGLAVAVLVWTVVIPAVVTAGALRRASRLERMAPRAGSDAVATGRQARGTDQNVATPWLGAGRDGAMACPLRSSSRGRARTRPTARRQPGGGESLWGDPR